MKMFPTTSNPLMGFVFMFLLNDVVPGGGDLFEEQDGQRVAELNQDIPSAAAKNFKFVQNQFYKTFSQTLSQSCSVVKTFGGLWVNSTGSCRSVDGMKVVCLDDLMPSVQANKCLIYSFGIAEDWSFEDTMGFLGCRVRAFDPTIEAPRFSSSNVTFERIGIAHRAGFAEIAKKKVQVLSLADILEKYSEQDKEISYLKLDVEGWEIYAMSKWSKNPRLLQNVQQIQIELHMGINDTIGIYEKLIKALRGLNKQGFRMVSYRPNVCLEKKHDFEQKFHTHFDVLFVRKS